MTCEDYELLLLSGEPVGAEAHSHVATCAACQAFRDEVPELLDDAAMPLLSLAERARLDALPQAVLKAYRAPQPSRGPWRQVVSLALAASVGALITSAVFKLTPGQAPLPAADSAPLTLVAADQVGFSDSAGFELATASDDGADDDSLEVSWPSINEGEAP